jgi:hypothetical protein
VWCRGEKGRRGGRGESGRGKGAKRVRDVRKRRDDAEKSRHAAARVLGLYGHVRSTRRVVPWLLGGDVPLDQRTVVACVVLFVACEGRHLEGAP